MPFKKYFTRKNILIISAFISVGLSFFVAKNIFANSYSGAGDKMGTLLLMLTGWLAEILIYVLGQLLLIAISILIKVASFNDFVNANIVSIGWVIMRDIANLGIVIVMLIMAFGTTLNKQQYHYRTLLPKLILAAILVNFSKSITGLLIDASQLVMMTFVHAFETIAAGNITYGLGVEDMLSVRSGIKSATGSVSEINDWNVLGALILGVVMLAVGLGVVVSLAVMFLYRIIVLWLLIIFSPVAFVGNLLPGASQYVSQWRSMLTNYLVKGPTLAFMFWLAMTVLSQITQENRLINLQIQQQQAAFGVTSSSVDYAYFASKISSPQRVFDYLVTVVLFIFTMKTAAAAGVMGASVAGAAFGKLQGMGRWIQKRPGVWGKKGWERTKKSYVGEGVTALAQRGIKAIHFDKEYREQQAAKRKARMQEYLGGKKGAIERFEWAQAMKVRKDMEDAGDFRNPKARKDALESARDKGDLAKAVAALMEMAKNKELTAEETKKFFSGFEGTMKTEAGKERIKGYVSTAWDTQANAGDKSVGLNRNFGVDEFGHYRELSEDDRIKNVQKEYKTVKTADLVDGGKLKAMASLPRNNKATHEFYSMAASRKDLGFWSATERDQITDHIDNILADDKAKSGNVIGVTAEDDVRRRNMVKLRNELVAMKDSNNYNTRTRELLDTTIAAADTMQGVTGVTSNYDNFLVAGVSNGARTLEPSNYLPDKRKKIITAEAETGKQKRILGTHEETEVGKAIKKQIIANMDLKSALDNIYQARQRAAISGNASGLKNAVTTAYNLIEQEINKPNSKISLTNPGTGEKFSGNELFNEFKKSEMGKDFDSLLFSHGKDALNLSDSIIMDIQDSSNGWKILRQTLADEEKGWRNTPEARQKMRQKTIRTARKARTNLDALKGPQSQPKVWNKLGMPTKFGLTTTKEVRRLAKTMRQLNEYPELIQDETYIDDINKFDEQYKIYRKSTIPAERTMARQEMETIAERVLKRFEPLT